MKTSSLNDRFAPGRSWRGFVAGIAVLFLAVTGQAAVTLTSYQFTADNLPYIQAAATDLASAQAAAGPGGYYKLRAKILVPWDPGYHHGIDSSNNLNSRLSSVPGAGTYNVQLYWAAYNTSGVFQAKGPFNEQTIMISPPAAGSAGLMAEYYNGASFGTLVRTVPSGETPNYDWVDRGPLSTGVDNFSARWTGYIEPLYSENYTITIGSDDGMRVYIEDMSTPLVGIWWDHGYFEDSRQIQFVAGRRYAIKVEFFENWGGAGAHLYWESNSQVRQEVPVTRLFPVDTGGGSPSQVPVVVTHPQGQTVGAGSLAYFTVVATGTPWPTYQWRKNSTVINGATAASYTLSAVQPADAGGYDVVIMNSAGSVTSAVATLTVNSGGGGAGGGAGLRGDYYNGADFGSLVATRTDWQVNFDWGNGSPISGVGADYFSVRWSGQIEAPVSGYYTFSTNSDDGVRLKLNGATAIDDWTAHPAYDRFSTQVHLQAGSKTSVVLEYFENGGGANVQLYWQPPGQTNRVLIPRDRLYSAIAPEGGTGWQTLNAESRTISFTVGSDKDGNSVWVAQPVEHYLAVPSNGTLRIYTTGSADTVGLLRNSDGSVILETWLDAGGDGGNFRLERAINAGAYVLQMVARFAGDVFEDYTAYVEFLPAPGSITPPSITSGAAAAGTVGAAFSGYTVTASGSAPISYSVANLPPGLGITAASGSVTGTPTVAGTFTATVTAINAAGSNSKAVTFTIAAVAGGGTSAAAGGSVSRVGDFLVHTFTSSGVFSLPSTRNCDVLVVAGGGGGGQGGGGGGGFNYLPGLSVPAGSTSVSVGYGGASSSPWGGGNNGTDSQFGSFLIAHGGGGGGNRGERGNSGGSGGGSGRDANISSGGSAAWGGEGNTGGGAPSDGWCSSGGGGGAGGAGGSGNSFIYTDDKGGDGGNGRPCDITGGSIFYAGGGGGTNESGGGALPTGGVGGGGAGSRSYQYGASGTNGLGGGGGAGAAGGSGVVIVRYYSPLVVGTAPTITSGASATGTVGSAFSSYTVGASGTTPMTYLSSGLPPGLSLNAGSGAVSGAPTAAGSYPVQFTATNVAGSAVKTVTFTIAAGLVAPIAFAAEQVTPTRFLATWSPVAGATGYRLDVSINPSFTNLILNDFAVTYLVNGQTVAGTSHTVSRAAGNTEYWYRVRAITSAGTSPHSSSVFVPASGTASASPPASLWFDMPVDRKINGVWTKVYDGVPDEIIPSGGVRGLTYYVLDWRYTGGSVTFFDYGASVNDWWYLRNGYLDINGDGSTDFSSADFTSWWIPGITFSYPGETYFRLGVEFNPEPGQLYDVCYSTNTVISASSLGLVNGGAGISADTNARLTFALFNEFTAAELDHGSLYLVRRVFAPSGVQVNLPIIGDVALRKGIGGASGVITLPGDVTITASATSATISKAGAGSVTVSNGAISGAINLGGGYVLGGVTNGNLSLTLPSGAVVTTGPGGTTLSIPGGGTVTVSSGGAIGMTVPAGSGAALRTAVDQLGILLGLGVSGGPSASVKILPSGGSPGSAIWEPANGILLGNRPAGDYSVGMKETNAPDDRAVWITLTVQPPAIQIAVDANRDGVINFNASDATTASAPYRFWLNDDIDRMAHESNPVFTEDEEDDLLVSPNGKLDWEDNVANSRRDLEDFSRLVVSINGLSDAFKNGDLYMGLKWADTTGTPAIKLHWQYDPTGSTSYLTNDFQAALQVTQNAILNQRYASENVLTSPHTLVETGELFVLPQGFWLGLPAGELKRTVLFEGCKAGKGQLKLVILNRDGANYTEIGEGPGVWMDLQKPKEFIERWSAGDGDADTPVLPVVRQSANSGTFAAPTTDEQKDYVLYVHGYNMQEFEKQRWIETTYKRLYYLGYKGRVAGFTWPCAQSFLPFDDSEVRAWEAGAQLKNLLSALKGGGYRVHVLAHSQGNIVVAEALRQWKAAGNTTALVATYIASQAAIAAHCYDPAAPLIPGFAGSLSDDGTPNVYLNYPPTSLPYLGTAATSGTAARFRNFQNPGDWALTGNSINPFSNDFKPIWQAGQRLKPDFGYGWASSTGFYKAPWIPGVTDYHFPDDRFKIFAYCAEGRSLALGSTETEGVFAGPDTNLSGTFGYGLEHKWHSGQFRSYMAVRFPYWIAVLDAALIPHLTP